MWILLAFIALFAKASETTLDKVALVKDKSIDTLSATFIRILIFWLLFVLVGALGLLGEFRLLLTWPIVFLGLLYAGSAVFYTAVLKKIEVTSYSILSYATPLIYLLIDKFVLRIGLSAYQVIGILLLVGGSLLFVVDPKVFQIKRVHVYRSSRTPVFFCYQCSGVLYI